MSKAKQCNLVLPSHGTERQTDRTPPPPQSLGWTWKCINLDSSLQSKGSFEESPVVSPEGEVTQYPEKNVKVTVTVDADPSRAEGTVTCLRQRVYIQPHLAAR
ncbi:hypothetical protein F2P81_004765 [Scophthalmus maximus]|uniref:Uncharacterized protein n=1 Tax=Scophthalmus maximus TaxID=52904 RepID=A0A6A4TG58_SCOMX|nr:hypothetical protein F2P81_004765 [Scophthalmus maximus]